ncbi:MAG: 4-hydroxythreonine-4-phosphate dehydrogenase PdxA [Candidatus Saccharibacteria bacterium]|nr:4-hydroxythreonine-4-phosphate dehydrogenase PdxA [Pseudorhodobacter sp.]
MSANLALTMGDPCGIGPEIIVKAVALLTDRLQAGTLTLTLVGSARIFAETAARLGSSLNGAGVTLDDIDGLHQRRPDELRIGQISAGGGHLAYLAIRRAVDLAVAGSVDAIVTAPLQKESLHLAGYPHAGHTELLAELTGVKGSVMMLAHGAFRVSHVTTHVALEKVPSLITPDRLIRVATLTEQALHRMGIARPRIAFAALNPHAGEGGIFGRQDIDVTQPTVSLLRAQGMDVTGPVPGDTVFVKHRGGQFDAVVAMYHDQGHIPVKLLGFDVDPVTGQWKSLSGVNISLGLPIIRTSVDHGTALDIAGKGIADATSLIEAIDMAELLSGKPVHEG